MNPSPESWLERKAPAVQKTFDLADYPNHHLARIRCRNCGLVFPALYPKAANPSTLECSSCGAQDSEIERYLKFIYTQ